MKLNPRQAFLLGFYSIPGKLLLAADIRWSEWSRPVIMAYKRGKEAAKNA